MFTPACTHHNQPTRPTTHFPHAPCTAPHAWEVRWWAPQSWVISPPFTPIFTLRAGPSHLSARSERYLRIAFELEGPVWCVLISATSPLRLSKRRDPQRPAIYRRECSANNCDQRKYIYSLGDLVKQDTRAGARQAHCGRGYTHLFNTHQHGHKLNEHTMRQGRTHLHRQPLAARYDSPLGRKPKKQPTRNMNEHAF